MHHDITGIILAGGKSSRMGKDKSELMIGDKTVLEITVHLLRLVCKENMVCIGMDAEEFRCTLPIVRDVYSNTGPLAGIHAGLLHSSNEKNFIISCDMPLMNQEMIEYIIAQAGAAPITVVRVAGFVQPLAGLYCKQVLPQIEKMLTLPADTRKRFSVHGLLAGVATKIIDPVGLPFYRQELFFNMNDKKDYEQIIRLTTNLQ